MKNCFFKLFATGIAIMLVGCGGNDYVEMNQLKGRVLGEGALEGAIICLDKNLNYQCDSDEAVVASDVNGSFVLYYNSTDEGQLLAKLSPEVKDSTHNRSLLHNNLLSAPIDSNVISPYTTLALLESQHADVNYTQAAENISQMTFGDIRNINGDYLQDKESSLVANYLLSGMGTNLEILGYLNDTSLDKASLMMSVRDYIDSTQEQMRSFLNMAHNHLEQPLLSGELLFMPKGTLTATKLSWEQGMLYGRGYSDVSRSFIPGSSCLEEGYKLNWADSESSEFIFKLVESKEALHEALQVSGRLSLNKTGISGSLSGGFSDDYDKNTNSVFVYIQYKKEFGAWNVEGAKLKPAFQTMLDEDPTQFQTVCGDKFLSTAILGGEFIGLLEIQASSLSEKQNIQASLKGSYNAGVIKADVEGDFNKVLSSVTSQYITTVRSGSRGGKGTPKFVTNVEELQAEASSFITETQSACKREAGECLYLANFADYAEITPSAPVETELVARKKEMLPLYDKALSNSETSSYEGVLNGFNFVKNFKQYFGSEYTTKTYIQNLSTKITQGKSQLLHTASICEGADEGSNPLEVCPNIETALSGVTPDDLMAMLPDTNALPVESCQEYSAVYHQRLSKETVTLYLDRDLDKSFTAFCDNDKTYLPLTYHSNPSSALLRYNYARAQNLRDANGNIFNMVTAFEKLNVEVQGDTLMVNPSDFTYASTFSYSPNNDINASALFFGASHQEMSDVPFGSVYTGLCPERTKTNGVVKRTNNFKYIPTKMTWLDAKSYAQSHGGTLAMLNNSGEFLEVAELLEKNNVNEEYWIGLREEKARNYYKGVENAFNWVGGSTPYLNKFTRFYPTYPRHGLDPKGVQTSSCYGIPSKDNHWECTYNEAEKKSFLMRLNTPEVIEEQIVLPDTSNCNTIDIYANIYLKRSNFSLSNFNIYFEGNGITQEIKNAVILNGNDENLSIKEPFPNESKEWVIPPSELELVYL